MCNRTQLNIRVSDFRDNSRCQTILVMDGQNTADFMCSLAGGPIGLPNNIVSDGWSE